MQGGARARTRRQAARSYVSVGDSGETLAQLQTAADGALGCYRNTCAVSLKGEAMCRPYFTVCTFALTPSEKAPLREERVLRTKSFFFFFPFSDRFGLLSKRKDSAAPGDNGADSRPAIMDAVTFPLWSERILIGKFRFPRVTPEIKTSDVSPSFCKSMNHRIFFNFRDFSRISCVLSGM